MRFVDRQSVAAPASLTAAKGAGERELKRARLHYQGASAESYKFKAYKRDDVKEALRELFKKKCAYCESFHESTSPADIEHYRPKAGVDQEPGHRGYWWLAADWSNLLRSCIGCNRVEGHRIASNGMTMAQIDALLPVLAGKGNSFPIVAARAFVPDDDCDGEDPLLIDPTRRDPNLHLAWHTEQDLSLIGPRFNGGVPDVYGDNTIAIVALNRQSLVEARSRHLQGLNDLVLDLEEALEEAAVAAAENRARPLARARRKLEALWAATGPEREFSAMAQAFVDREVLRLREQYLELLP